MKTLDIAEYLQTEEDCRVFLQEVADIGDVDEFIHALGIVARAKGMSKIAETIGVGRTSLYKSLSENGNPSFETVFKVLNAMGFKLSFVPTSLSEV